MGYIGYSMSERAMQAYESGEKPLSKWSKSEILNAIKNEIGECSKLDVLRKYDLKLLRRYCLRRSSWHHTSSYYNETNFYEIDTNWLEETYPSFMQHILDNNSKQSKQPKEETTKKLGTIEYLTWTGTRKHPKATENKLENVMIEEKGSFYIVYRNDVEILRKKIGSNGTYVEYNKEM